MSISIGNAQKLVSFTVNKCAILIKPCTMLANTTKSNIHLLLFKFVFTVSRWRLFFLTYFVKFYKEVGVPNSIKRHTQVSDILIGEVKKKRGCRPNWGLMNLGGTWGLMPIQDSWHAWLICLYSLKRVNTRNSPKQNFQNNTKNKINCWCSYYNRVLSRISSNNLRSFYRPCLWSLISVQFQAQFIVNWSYLYM